MMYIFFYQIFIIKLKMLFSFVVSGVQMLDTDNIMCLARTVEFGTYCLSPQLFEKQRTANKNNSLKIAAETIRLLQIFSDISTKPLHCFSRASLSF